MSIDALVTGKLWKKPQGRQSGAGRPFVTASVRAADGEGESLFINVVAFSNTAQAALLALNEGDSVALAGTLKIGTYEAAGGSVKPSVSMVANNVLTTYHVTRKRKAVAEPRAPEDRGVRESALDDDPVDF